MCVFLPKYVICQVDVVKEEQLQHDRTKLTVLAWIKNGSDVNQPASRKRSISIMAGNVVTNQLYFKATVSETEMMTASENAPWKRTFLVSDCSRFVLKDDLYTIFLIIV